MDNFRQEMKILRNVEIKKTKMNIRLKNLPETEPEKILAPIFGFLAYLETI